MQNGKSGTWKSQKGVRKHFVPLPKPVHGYLSSFFFLQVLTWLFFINGSYDGHTLDNSAKEIIG